MTVNTTEQTSNFTDLADSAPKEVATLEITSVNKSEIFTKEECQKKSA